MDVFAEEEPQPEECQSSRTVNTRRTDNPVTKFRLDNGLCHTCGTQLYEFSSSNKVQPLTVPGQVKGGRCLFCYPDKVSTPSTPPEGLSVAVASTSAASSASLNSACANPSLRIPARSKKSTPLCTLESSNSDSDSNSDDLLVEGDCHEKPKAKPRARSAGKNRRKVFSSSSARNSESTYQRKKRVVTIRDAEGAEYKGTLSSGTLRKGRGTFSRTCRSGDFKGKKSTYEGEICNGLMHGYGKQVVGSGCVYEGEFRNGASQGRGKCTWPGGWEYEGEWVNDFREGDGRCRQIVLGRNASNDGTKGEVYTGEWKADKWHGVGLLQFAEGGDYEGEFREGKIEGEGRYLFTDGSCYIGSFRQDLRKGKGSMAYADGTRYEGEWNNNWREGTGILFYGGGRRFEGTFRHDEPLDGFLHSQDGILERVVNGESASAGL